MIIAKGDSGFLSEPRRRLVDKENGISGPRADCFDSNTYESPLLERFNCPELTEEQVDSLRLSKKPTTGTLTRTEFKASGSLRYSVAPTLEGGFAA
jgi:hypothetical protein